MRTKPESEKISIDLKNLKFDLTKPGKNSKFILIVILIFYLAVISVLAYFLRAWLFAAIGGASLLPAIYNPLKQMINKKRGSSP